MEILLFLKLDHLSHQKLKELLILFLLRFHFLVKLIPLRDFLNRLAEFDRPIVVRSINVSRPNEIIKRKLYVEAEEEYAILV